MSEKPKTQLPAETDIPRVSFDHSSSLEDGRSSEHGSVEPKSKGVIEMESLQGRLTPVLLGVLYGTFMLLAYSLSLSESAAVSAQAKLTSADQYTSSAFLNYGVSYSFGKHSLQATIGVVTAVFQAMSQPPIAKLADVFGRVPAYIGCVVLYVIGYIIVASSQSIVTYAVGNSIYILGITGLFLLQNIIISDISSLRNRCKWPVTVGSCRADLLQTGGLSSRRFLARSMRSCPEILSLPSCPEGTRPSSGAGASVRWSPVMTPNPQASSSSSPPPWRFPSSSHSGVRPAPRVK